MVLIFVQLANDTSLVIDIEGPAGGVVLGFLEDITADKGSVMSCYCTTSAPKRTILKWFAQPLSCLVDMHTINNMYTMNNGPFYSMNLCMH